MIGRIFGIGIGTIILSAIWSICLLFCLSSARKKGIQFAIVYPFLGALFTIGLLIWPIEQCGESSRSSIIVENTGNEEQAAIEQILSRGDASINVESEIDWLAIPRLLLAIVLFVLSTFAIIHQIRHFLYQPAPIAPRIKN